MENLRLAYEQECNRRKQVQDKAQRIEQENGYLQTQLKIEQKGKADLQQKHATYKLQFSELHQKLQQKEAELQRRTEELIQARSSQDDVIEEEIQRLRDVERVTNKARSKQNKFLSVLSEVMCSNNKMRVKRANYIRWKNVVHSISKRLNFLKLVSKHCFWHCVGKIFLLWRSHIELLNNLRVDLDRFFFKKNKSCVRRMMFLWFRGAMLSAKTTRDAKIQEFEVCCDKLRMREKELVEQIDSTLELMEAADSKHSRKLEDLKGINLQQRLELQTLEARLSEAYSERRQLEQRLAAAESISSHLDDARSRLLEAEEGARGLAEELRLVREEKRQCLASQRLLEDAVSALELRVASQDRRTRELEDRNRAAEAESARMAAQAEARSAQLSTLQGALTAEKETRIMLEERSRQRDTELTTVRREVRELASVQEQLEEEEGRRRAVEDALGKLVSAFQEQKQSIRRRQQFVADRLRISKAFFWWVRDSLKAAIQRAHDRIQAVERECETQRAALDEEGEALRSCMQQLTAMRLAADEAAAREAGLEAARARAEGQLTELKARYLEGVKSSVQTIRLCRDRYLATSPGGIADLHGAAGAGPGGGVGSSEASDGD